MLVLIFSHRRRHPINISKLLIANTYLAIILSCVALFDMYAHNIYGIFHQESTLENGWCYGRTYFLHVGCTSLYYSCLLQACFRLFRVVFYKYRQLQTFRFIVQLVIVQWLMAFLSMIILLLLRYFEYVPQLYHCQIPFTNSQGMIVSFSIIFVIPINAIAGIYCYIMYYIKYKANSPIQRNRRRTYQRDVIVLRRIIILIGILFIISVPTIILWMTYLITGYLHPLIHHIEWLIYSITLVVLSIALAFLSPDLQQLVLVTWRRNRRIQPIITIRQHILHQTNTP